MTSNTFTSLGITKAFTQQLTSLGVENPTEIQKKTIPEILASTKDVVGIAHTGTGKTLAFGLPLLQLINTQLNTIQAVILAPTRELGQQISKNLTQYAAAFPDIAIATVCGGVPIKPQIALLATTTHIVIATPGRLIDLIQRNAIKINTASYLVVDEADEMVNSLKEGLDKIVAEMPANRRTFLFSATLPGAIKQLIQNYMNKHVTEIRITTPEHEKVAIKHQYVVVEPIEKLNVLLYFLSTQEGKQGIIFCKTKAAVNKLAKNLAINKFSSGALHGSLSQGIRDRIMEQFRAGHVSILVATDLAARGIDIKNLAYIVHYHLPATYETYVHRSGRTARAGQTGLALSIIQEDEVADIPDFEEELSIKFTPFKKPDTLSIEEHNTVLWAKKIFKTKPNTAISAELKQKVKTVFHHLTKDELVEKLMANYIISQQKSVLEQLPKKAKKKKPKQ